MGIEIEEVRTVDRLNRLASEWDDVLRGSGEDSIFLGLPWLLSWWSIFGETRELMVLHATEGGRSVGFAPFMISSRGKISCWRKLEFIGSGPTDRLAIIARDGRRDVHRAFWDHVKEKDDWDVVELREMTAGDITEGIIREYYPSAEYVQALSPHILLEGNYESYLSGLSKNMRYNLGRNRRKLEESGAAFRTLRTPSEVAEGVHYLRKLSEARWDLASVLVMPHMVEFIELAAGELAKKGEMVFHTIELGDEPIAITMGFEAEHKYMYYLSGFDPEHSKTSPGSVLLSRIIEESYGKGMSEVDLLRGTEPYKYRFNAVDRVLFHFRALNRGLWRSARCAVRETPLN
jgi:CelD/BcsL family acetyltransferase involved in cellulose biosynthesis